MRAVLLFLVVICSGCKTMEFAMQHPASGVCFMARVVSDPVAPSPSMNISIPMPAPAEATTATPSQVAEHVAKN